MEPVRFAVLGTAKIALEKVIPAMQASKHCRIAAIASRDLGRRRGGGSGAGHSAGLWLRTRQLLADPEIEAIYNPLPNHLHVPCRSRPPKPASMCCARSRSPLTPPRRRAGGGARSHRRADRRGVHGALPSAMDAGARTGLARHASGRCASSRGCFSYMNRDPANVRNQADIGGGGVYDIGCYPIVDSRFLFRRSRSGWSALIEHDPDFETDRLASVGDASFRAGQALFFCSTQLVPYQRMQILGSDGRIEIEIPFNAPPDQPCRIFLDDGSALGGGAARAEIFDVVNQYTLQGDLFAGAIRGGTKLPFPLEDSVLNMKVLDAVFRSGKSGRFETV